MAERSKARVREWSLAGMAGSNPAGSMDACLLGVLCLLSGTGPFDGPIPLQEESYRLWCWMWSRNLKDEAALARFGNGKLGEKFMVAVLNYSCREAFI